MVSQVVMLKLGKKIGYMGYIKVHSTELKLSFGFNVQISNHEQQFLNFQKSGLLTSKVHSFPNCKTDVKKQKRFVTPSFNCYYDLKG